MACVWLLLPLLTGSSWVSSSALCRDRIAGSASCASPQGFLQAIPLALKRRAFVIFRLGRKMLCSLVLFHEYSEDYSFLFSVVSCSCAFSYPPRCAVASFPWICPLRGVLQTRFSGGAGKHGSHRLHTCSSPHGLGWWYNSLSQSDLSWKGCEKCPWKDKALLRIPRYREIAVFPHCSGIYRCVCNRIRWYLSWACLLWCCCYPWHRYVGNSLFISPLLLKVPLVRPDPSLLVTKPRLKQGTLGPLVLLEEL